MFGKYVEVKNKEYRSNFYALAKVYENQGLEEAAIRNYKLAAKTASLVRLKENLLALRII